MAVMAPFFLPLGGVSSSSSPKSYSVKASWTAAAAEGPEASTTALVAALTWTHYYCIINIMHVEYKSICL